MNKKILIFENEINLVKGIFDLFNIMIAKNSLEFDYFTSSQDFQNIENVVHYDFIFVDLSLSERSEVGGSTLIDRIIDIPNHPDIAIITGRSNPEEILKKKNLDYLPLFIKPIRKDDHFDYIKKLIFKN